MGRPPRAARVGDSWLLAKPLRKKKHRHKTAEGVKSKDRRCDVLRRPQAEAAGVARPSRSCSRRRSERRGGGRRRGRGRRREVRRAPPLRVVKVSWSGPRGRRRGSVGKLAKKIHKAHPGLALFVVAGGGGKVGAFAAVLDGRYAGARGSAPRGRWRAGRRQVDLRAGVGEGRRRRGRGGGGAGVRPVTAHRVNLVEEISVALPVGGGAAATARSTGVILSSSVSAGGLGPC